MPMTAGHGQRATTEQEREFYAGFAGGGVLRAAPGARVRAFKRSVEEGQSWLMGQLGTEAVQDARIAAHNLIEALNKVLEETGA